MTNPQILVDSDAFIGLIKQDDSMHQVAVRGFENIKRRGELITTTSLVIAETATTLSNKVNQKTAVQFLNFVEHFSAIHISQELQAEALALFKQQTKKRTSVVDCANVVVGQRFNIPKIFSFDKFYRRYLELVI